MDIFDYLNSESERKYLQEIDYRFSPQEAAFIVWNADRKTEDKLAALKEIAETMPDQAVRCRSDYPKYPSLRRFLNDYTALVSRVGERADERKLSDEDFYLYNAFECMWFNIPTPFEKGDIVCTKSKFTEKYDNYVLLDINNWSKADFIKNGYTDRDLDLDKIDARLAKRATCGDYGDMSAHGYRIFGNGNIDYDFFCNYIDFEYYHESELSGTERALIPLSAFIRGDIDLELFLNAYKVIVDEERVKDEKSILCTDDDGLRLMGLKK